MAQDENVTRGGVKQNAVGVAGNIDRLDHRQRIGVEHSNRLTGGKAVMRIRVHCNAARICVRDAAGRRQGVQVVDIDP